MLITKDKKTTEDYVELYDQRYPGDNAVHLDEDIQSWFNRWLGFESFTEFMTVNILLSDTIAESLKENLAHDPKRKWIQTVTVTAAQELAVTFLKIAYLMDCLRDKEKELGVGAVLEEVARTEHNYAGLINQFVMGYPQIYQECVDNRPGLFDFAGEYFYEFLNQPLKDDREFQRLQQILERGNMDDCIEGLINDYLDPLSGSMIGVMKVLTGFYAYLQRKEGK